jgi:hypothetical protein
VNKEGTAQAADVLPVSEGVLPEHLVAEFVNLTDGLLSNFAVTAVAAVRRGAHHALSRFGRHLDGAYLSHRISLPGPEDAEDLAVERVSIELTSLIENADVAGTTLSAEVIDRWLDDRGATHVFKTSTAKVPLPVMKELVRSGASRLKDKAGQERLDSAAPPKTPISDKTVLNVFYADDGAARRAARQFARLTTYKRESGRVRLDGYRPHLTLGALLRVRRDIGAAETYADIESDYLICVQPRCDSVRLDGPRAFPFQQAKHDPQKFNLIAPNEAESAYLVVDSRPMAGIILKFAPAQNETVIRAQSEAGAFVFKDDRGRAFEWIADLDDLKAQRLASDLGASTHRVGVDEFEWLRLGARGDIRPEAQPVGQSSPEKPDPG